MSAPRPLAARRRFPAPPAAAVSVELEIPFSHVDLLGIAWHGRYAEYLDLARTALLRTRRLDAEDLRGLGFLLMVSESFVHHASPLRYGDRVRVSAWFGGVENRLHVAYQVSNLTAGVLAAEAWTDLVTATADGRLCLETPPPLLARLRAPGPGAAEGGPAGR
jgi:acyl-CoA thioester hydrolase